MFQGRVVYHLSQELQIVYLYVERREPWTFFKPKNAQRCMGDFDPADPIAMQVVAHAD